MDKEFSDFITKVLDKTDIVSVISRYVKVERKGNTYWACCPFHHESQPSFSVSPDKQFFHCFGCKESGNALSFLMKIENIEFIDALKMLAEQAGLEMPKPKNKTYTRDLVDKKQRERLFELMRVAARHYYDNLSSPRAKMFNDYLRAREIPPEMVRKFGLGASLDFTEMLEFLKSRGYTYKEMSDAGIAGEKNGRYYDVFGSRLMFPVIDNMNHVVAFGGRTLEKDAHFAKYRNSSETWFFEKAQVIYGVNLLKKLKNSGAQPITSVIVVEGYMDVISLHKAGFNTAVATMGTAFTTKNARQLKQYTDTIYISYDGDTAGQKAIMRGLDILREVGLTVKVVRLPDGLDPDDLIKRDGAQGYQKLLDEAVQLTQHKIDVLKSSYDLSDPDKKAQFAVESVKVISAHGNAVERDRYFAYVSSVTGFAVDDLKRQARDDLSAKAKRMQTQAATRDAESPQSDVAQAEYPDALKFFLASIILKRDYVDFDRVLTDAMPDGFSKRLYNWCRQHEGFGITDVFNEFGYDNKLLNELQDYEFKPGDGRQKFVDVQNDLYRAVLTKERDNLSYLHKTTNDPKYLEMVGKLNIELSKLKKYRS